MYKLNVTVSYVVKTLNREEVKEIACVALQRTIPDCMCQLYKLTGLLHKAIIHSVSIKYVVCGGSLKPYSIRVK